MSTVEFTDEDVHYAEKILLGNKTFDMNEKLPIIKRMDTSISVMACPGSGKTTALMGKIIALVNHLPLNDGKGICIITHTNVAINEIKNRLGSRGDILFQYPNFIGTIQAFTDKFLSIPFLKQTYGKGITAINDEYYYQKMFQKKKEITILKKYAYGKCGRDYSKTDNYIKSIILRRKDGEFDFCIGNKSLNLKNKSSETYKALYSLLVDNLFSQGILRYDDTYLLAQMYLEKHPELSNYFCSRFQYVFMDEVQDNRKVQNEILDKIFLPDRMVVQKFGDMDQAIYDDKEEAESSVFGVKYEISKSMRFPQNIADIIENLRVEPHEKALKGKESTDAFIYILVYEYDKIYDVKDKFIDLILEHNLKKDKSVFKCCGWVGYKENDKQLSLKSYYPMYLSNKDVNIKQIGISFQSILEENAKHNITVGLIYKSVIECIVRFLNMNDILFEEKRITYYVLEKYVKNNMEVEWKNLRRLIVREAINIKNYDEAAFKIIGMEALHIVYPFIENCDKKRFLKLFEKQIGSKKNVLYNCYVKNGVSVVFDTVHGVKGETHTGTLYVETYFNKKTDMQRILKFMLNSNVKNMGIDEKKALKVGYVGMSRATDLLCIAICDDTFKMFEKGMRELEQSGRIQICHV
ncbi:ATP-dependent helicase [Clostridiaceae bacterium]|nr:ATP-dependent helicase [Clostridiaceae bacterium]